MGLLAGWLLGALAYAAGLAASALFDWPAEPAIVVALATTALIAGNIYGLPQTRDSASIQLLHSDPNTPTRDAPVFQKKQGQDA